MAMGVSITILRGPPWDIEVEEEPIGDRAVEEEAELDGVGKSMMDGGAFLL